MSRRSENDRTNNELGGDEAQKKRIEEGADEVYNNGLAPEYKLQKKGLSKDEIAGLRESSVTKVVIDAQERARRYQNMDLHSPEAQERYNKESAVAKEFEDKFRKMLPDFFARGEKLTVKGKKITNMEDLAKRDYIEVSADNLVSRLFWVIACDPAVPPHKIESEVKKFMNNDNFMKSVMEMPGFGSDQNDSASSRMVGRAILMAGEIHFGESVGDGNNYKIGAQHDEEATKAFVRKAHDLYPNTPMFSEEVTKKLEEFSHKFDEGQDNEIKGQVSINEDSVKKSSGFLNVIGDFFSKLFSALFNAMKATKNRGYLKEKFEKSRESSLSGQEDPALREMGRVVEVISSALRGANTEKYSGFEGAGLADEDAQNLFLNYASDQMVNRVTDQYIKHKTDGRLENNPLDYEVTREAMLLSTEALGELSNNPKLQNHSEVRVLRNGRFSITDIHDDIESRRIPADAHLSDVVNSKIENEAKRAKTQQHTPSFVERFASNRNSGIRER